MTRKIIYIVTGCGLSLFVSAQNTVINNRNLKVEVNNELQTKINSTFSNAKPLTNNFSSSEYFETKYFTAKLFHQTKKVKQTIHDVAGDGTEYKFYGSDDADKVEKILSLKVYNNFADAAYFIVQYINHGKKDLPVIRWVNNEYNVIPSADTTKFWSFREARMTTAATGYKK